MKIRASSRSSRGVCPFCRAELSSEGLRRCGACATVMHEDCFHENGGCTSLGCGERSETMPRCLGCEEMLASPSATFCVLCGFDQVAGRVIEGAPSGARQRNFIERRRGAERDRRSTERRRRQLSVEWRGSFEDSAEADGDEEASSVWFRRALWAGAGLILVSLLSSGILTEFPRLGVYAQLLGFVAIAVAVGVLSLLYYRS